MKPMPLIMFRWIYTIDNRLLYAEAGYHEIMVNCETENTQILYNIIFMAVYKIVNSWRAKQLI